MQMISTDLYDNDNESHFIGIFQTSNVHETKHKLYKYRKLSWFEHCIPGWCTNVSGGFRFCNIHPNGIVLSIGCGASKLLVMPEVSY